jgi:hypothetical protein
MLVPSLWLVGIPMLCESPSHLRSLGSHVRVTRTILLFCTNLGATEAPRDRKIIVRPGALSSRTGGESRLGHRSIEFEQRIHGSQPLLHALTMQAMP